MLSKPPQGLFCLMPKAPYILLIIMLLAGIGAVGFVVTWDIPPPSKHVEKVLPDERFPR